jgi:hypothetical protein
VTFLLVAVQCLVDLDLLILSRLADNLLAFGVVRHHILIKVFLVNLLASGADVLQHILISVDLAHNRGRHIQSLFRQMRLAQVFLLIRSIFRSILVIQS